MRNFFLNLIHSILNLINKIISRSVHRVILDWPLDFGLQTAVLNEVCGDYHEFGVYRGRSFIKAAQVFRKLLPKDQFRQMHFWAYDSFEGLPETKDPYAPATYHKGAYAAPRDLFLKNVRAANIDLSQVKTVAGFYDQSLTAAKAAEAFANRRIAMTYIDCDIYESAVPIFEFITSGLQIGSVIVIDDWVRHHMHPGHGIQRAFNEWLTRHPSIKMNQIALSKRVAFVVYQI